MQSESEARENPRTDGEPSPTNEELAARVKAGHDDPNVKRVGSGPHPSTGRPHAVQRRFTHRKFYLPTKAGRLHPPPSEKSP